MDRTSFYTEVTVNGIQELDLLHHSLSKFKMKYEPGVYRVKEIDLMRPDLISFKIYRTIKYWWIICLVNNIRNIFVDFSVGDVLKIPNRLDIFDFYRKYKVR